MKEHRSQLDKDTAAAIGRELSAQFQECHNKFIETSWKLTQHNFLTNAGGAVAVLAYLGSAAKPSFAIWSLLLFLVGIIASGVEIRALLEIYSALHEDALRRRDGFMTDRCSIEESVPQISVAERAGKINKWSGWISQGAFSIGVVIGIGVYVLNAC